MRKQIVLTHNQACTYSKLKKSSMVTPVKMVVQKHEMKGQKHKTKVQKHETKERNKRMVVGEVIFQHL